MPTNLGTILRRVLAPSLRSVTFAERGFPGADSPATRGLERIPQAVVCGFEWGVETRDLWALELRLAMVEPELRGFAYEGATMACTIRDAMTGWRSRRTAELMLGKGHPHVFLTYIGIGFAMARLPRRLWRKVVPDLDPSPYHPTMSWLAVDGYGFDLAYFGTRKWVDNQHQPAGYPWLGCPDYFPRAVDQGIGRALWFIHGARPAEVTAAVNRFDPQRQPDLWSGVGLAAAFAGGCTESALGGLHDLAGRHRPELGLGAVFAAKARSYAGFVPEHTEHGVRALTGMTIAEATALADRTEVSGSGSAQPLPPYEIWRSRIRTHFQGSRASEIPAKVK